MAGSSPHPWGTPELGSRCAGIRRFIPTPVGNTPANPPKFDNPAVHPHTRGEHVTVRVKAVVSDGSSPHPWGTPQDGAKLGIGRRFIPTPVGNT